MDNVLRKQLYNEAIRIGDEILFKAEYDGNGIFWKTMSIDYDQKVSWKTDEGIYSGVSGICLFFIELYKQTKDKKYLNVAIEGMRWVEHYCVSNPTSYFAFYTGRMGVSFTMLKMSEVMNDRSYIKKALRIAEPCESFLEQQHVSDLLNGIAGTILGLIHLHSATQEKWVLNKIGLFVEHLLGSVQPGPVGLYWDRSNNNIRGLCGLSHGAAGIGFVFLELGHYFQNEVFYLIAQQAFSYENHWYDDKINNWPDFRKGIWRPDDFEKFEKAYRENNLVFFTNGADTNAWCHGAVGIGLSRLRGLHVLNRYSEDVERSIQKTAKKHINSINQRMTFTLCHGGGGDAELFLQAFQCFRQEQYMDLAENVAKNALQFKKENGLYLSGMHNNDQLEDTGLFLGVAGVAYFYLRVLEPFKTASVLFHVVDSKCNVKINYSNLTLPEVDLRKKLVNKAFPRTAKVIEAFSPQILTLWDSTVSPSVNTLIAFVNLIEKNFLARNTEEKCVLDVFKLELEKISIYNSIQSCAYQHIKEIVTAEKANHLMNPNIDGSRKAILNSDVRILCTEWNWSQSMQHQWIDNLSLSPDVYRLLLKPHNGEILEKEISTLTYTLLTIFGNETIIEEGIERTVQSFEIESAEQIASVKSIIQQQLRELFLAGILIVLD